jgi:hypothetical protein
LQIVIVVHIDEQEVEIMTTATITEPTFEEILVTALTNNLDSYSLFDLVEQTQTAIITAENDAKVAEAMALDPLQSPDPVKARAVMEDAKFRAARLQTLLPKLQTRANNVALREQYHQWCEERFDPLKPKVNEAAAKLAALYQNFVAEAVPLFAEIERLDAEIVSVSSARPYHANDGRSLRSVELTARGLTDFRIGSHKIMDIELPDWWHPTELLWPPNRQFDWSSMTPVRKHPGNEWWRDKEEIHAAATAEAAEANRIYQQGEAERRAAVHRERGIINH